MIVTAVERKGRRRQVNIYVDGRFALAVGSQLAAERGVRPGRALTATELDALGREEARRQAMESALRLLSYRQRSERELRDRLHRKGLEADVIDATLDRLRELGYVDDEAFARFWMDARQAASPRSRRLLAVELRRRGVAQHTADAATLDVEDDEAAYEAAGRRLRTLKTLAYARFREQLGSFLTRRGFSYDVARRTIDRCWEERGASQAGETSAGGRGEPSS